MASTCLNCQTPIAENFCSNCGQKKFKRIDRKYVVDEAQYLLVHTNKGFLYSVKNILKNPGKTAREFIDGNRVNHYKPLLLAFVLSGVSAFLSYKVLNLNELLGQFTTQMNGANANKAFSFLSSYNSVIMLAFLPVLAIFTSIIFRKWGQNYYEHIVMNAFGLSCYTLVTIIISYPILYAVRGNMDLFIKVFSGSTLIIPFIFVWFYKGFYPERSIGKIILKVFLIIVTVFLAYMAVIFIAVILIGILKGPEALKMMMQPK